jgi:hypothetical protein
MKKKFLVLMMMFVVMMVWAKVSSAQTNLCTITEWDSDYVLNGTNCVVVKVVYSNSVSTLSMWTSINLTSWVSANYLKEEHPAGYANPKWRKFYYKKDDADIDRFYKATAE